MTLPTDSRQARISRDARNCIFWSLLKTVQRQCYARFQSLETASTEVVDDIINGVIGPNWSSPELSRDVAICLCLWGRDVYGQTMVSSIEHKVFRSAKYYPMVMESSPRFLWYSRRRPTSSQKGKATTRWNRVLLFLWASSPRSYQASYTPAPKHRHHLCYSLSSIVFLRSGIRHFCLFGISYSPFYIRTPPSRHSTTQPRE